MALASISPLTHVTRFYNFARTIPVTWDAPYYAYASCFVANGDLVTTGWQLWNSTVANNLAINTSTLLGCAAALPARSASPPEYHAWSQLLYDYRGYEVVAGEAIVEWQNLHTRVLVTQRKMT